MTIVMLATEPKAGAYTDPGSGALAWQLVLAGLAGAIFYSRKITSWFRDRRGPKD